MNINTFGARLQGLRKEKNISQSALAKSLECSTSSISKYELGIRIPDIKFLDSAANFFSVSVDYLLGRSNARSVETDLRVSYDYIGLSEKAVDELKEICSSFSETEDDVFNFLCETKGITNIVQSVTKYSLLLHIMLLLARDIMLKQESDDKIDEELKELKERKRDFEYLRIEASRVLDQIQIRIINQYVLKKSGLRKTEYEKLLQFIDNTTIPEIDYPEIFKDMFK